MSNSFDKPRNIFLDLFVIITVSGVVLFILNIMNPNIFNDTTGLLDKKFLTFIEGSYVYDVGSDNEKHFNISKNGDFILKDVHYTFKEALSSTNAIYLLDDTQYVGLILNTNTITLKQITSSTPNKDEIDFTSPSINIANILVSIPDTTIIENSSKYFYYIDEFISDFTTYRNSGKELWNDDGIMSERVAREMNVIMALGNVFYNIPTDRNSDMIVKITDKDDYHIKKSTIPSMEHGLPYLIIVETFNTGYHSLKSYHEKDKQRRDYWKKTWVKSDEKGNNTFLFENPIYAIQDEYSDEFKQEATPTKNDKYYELYPNKAYVTFVFDKESVLLNKGYLIKFEEVNPLKQKFTYEILIDDQKLQEYRTQIK